MKEAIRSFGIVFRLDEYDLHLKMEGNEDEGKDTDNNKLKMIMIQILISFEKKYEIIYFNLDIWISNDFRPYTFAQYYYFRGCTQCQRW